MWHRSRWGIGLCLFSLFVHPPETLHAQSFALEEVQTLAAFDPAQSDGFGRALALRGALAVVGSPGDDDKGTSSGSVYVFRHDGLAFHFESKLRASDGELGDGFGSAVDVDGDWIVIGSPGDDDLCPRNPVCNSGAAYVFRYDGRTWREAVKLEAPDPGTFEGFGATVSIRGSSILVTAPNEDNCGPFEACDFGAGYVWGLEDGEWSLHQKLVAEDAEPFDRSGFAAALYGDVALLSAPLHNRSQGAARVFRTDGSFWSQEAKLVAAEGKSVDLFGVSVSLERDSLLIGARNFDVLGVENAGSVFAFRYDGESWIETAMLHAETPRQYDNFGEELASSQDLAIVGVPLNDDRCPSSHPNCNSGTGYLFYRDGSVWSQQAKFEAQETGFGDGFGTAVALEACTALVGASGATRDGRIAAGSVYVFSIRPRFAELLDTLGRQIREMGARSGLERAMLGMLERLRGRLTGADSDDDRLAILQLRVLMRLAASVDRGTEGEVVQTASRIARLWRRQPCLTGGSLLARTTGARSRIGIAPMAP